MATTSKFKVGASLQAFLNQAQVQKRLHTYVHDKIGASAETWWKNLDSYRLVSRPGQVSYFVYAQDYVIGTRIDESGNVYVIYTRHAYIPHEVVRCYGGRQRFCYMPNREGYEQLLEDVRAGAVIQCRTYEPEKKKFRERLGKWMAERDYSPEAIDRAHQYAWDYAATLDGSEWELDVLYCEDLREAYKDEVGTSSCMTHRTHLLDLYVENPSKVKLAVVGHDKARALLWFVKDKYIFVDRVYSGSQYECSASNIVALVKQRYPTWDVRRTTDPPTEDTVLEMTCSNELLPYSDSYSFTRAGDKVWVDPTGREGENQHCENGGGMVCAGCGETLTESAATMVNGEWYCDDCLNEHFVWVGGSVEYIDREYAVWSLSSETYIHEDDAQYIVWGDNGGDFVDASDVAYSMMVDGEFCVICHETNGSTAEDFVSWLSGKNIKTV